MKNGIQHLLAGAALLLPAGIVMAAAPASALPGDRGRPGTGITGPLTPEQVQAQLRRPVPHPAPAPSIDVALKAAQAIAAACKQYPLGIAVIDSEGVAKLIYVPDQSQSWHGYSAVRKAYAALTYNMAGSQLVTKALADPELAERIKADPNLQAAGGGLPLTVGGKLVGAIGVSGAEPGGHDEECGLKGLEAIKGDLK
jgi:uncharacterized protein GlcG (DUF336 family)